LVKASAPVADAGDGEHLGPPASSWRGTMLIPIVGLVAVAGLCFLLVKSRKQTAKSAR